MTKNKGFTFLSLTVGFIIIALIISIGMVKYSDVSKNALDEINKTEVEMVKLLLVDELDYRGEDKLIENKIILKNFTVEFDETTGLYVDKDGDVDKTRLSSLINEIKTNDKFIQVDKDYFLNNIKDESYFFYNLDTKETIKYIPYKDKKDL